MPAVNGSSSILTVTTDLDGIHLIRHTNDFKLIKSVKQFIEIKNEILYITQVELCFAAIDVYK
jgi:hypothetical protein